MGAFSGLARQPTLAIASKMATIQYRNTKINVLHIRQSPRGPFKNTHVVFESVGSGMMVALPGNCEVLSD